jgi:hypothetical protein
MKLLIKIKKYYSYIYYLVLNNKIHTLMKRKSYINLS